MINNRPYQQAYTILELLLVLVVAAAIMLMGYNQYAKLKVKRNVATVEGSVLILFNALRDYYWEYCPDSSKLSSSISWSKLEPFMSNPDLVVNPFYSRKDRSAQKNSFSFGFSSTSGEIARNDLQTKHWTATVKMNLPSDYNSKYKDMREVYRAMLNTSDTGTPNSYSWTRGIEAQNITESAGLSPLAQDVRFFASEEYVPPSQQKFRPPETRKKSHENPCGLESRHGYSF